MSANEVIRDAEVGRQVDLTHYANHVVRRMVALLNRTDPDLLAQLQAAIDRLDAQSFTVERLESLLYSIRSINAQAYQQLAGELQQEMRGLTAAEVGFQQHLFTTLDVGLSVASVNAEQVYSAAMARPFQGRLLSEWASSIADDRMARIRDAVRIGFVENQTNAQIVQRLKGTRANGYADGLLELDRRHVESVVRTAVMHTAGFARDRFYAANTDLIKALQWHSTLDSRTSAECRIRDGLLYTNEHKPIDHKVPWLGGPGRLHWCCRSTSVPVLKTWQELGIDATEASPGTRASMDGQVPADTTYSQWFKRQSAARQDEIIGATRGALYRKGKLPMDAFYNDKGRLLTLDQLREKAPRAFSEAGV